MISWQAGSVAGDRDFGGSDRFGGWHGETLAGVGGQGGDLGVGEVGLRGHVVLIGLRALTEHGGAAQDEGEEGLRVGAGDPGAARNRRLQERHTAAVGHVAGGAVLLEKFFAVRR